MHTFGLQVIASASSGSDNIWDGKELGHENYLFPFHLTANCSITLASRCNIWKNAWKNAKKISRGRPSGLCFRIAIVVWRWLLGGSMTLGDSRLLCQLRGCEHKMVKG